MDSYLLPSSIYESPSRQVRRLKLNTIMEDDVQSEDGHRRSKRMSQQSPSSSYSPKSAVSAMSVSTISSYYQGSRGSRVFDDLYDVSDSESDTDDNGLTISIKRASTDSDISTRSRNRYPSLVIPSPRNWPTIDNFKKNSPVPPTPPSKIPISPEVLSKLAPHPLMSSAPPSLDGSLSSDQIACSSAPPTPSLVCNPSVMINWSGVEIARSTSDFAEESGPSIEVSFAQTESKDLGVQLSDEAFNILQHLSYNSSADSGSVVEDDPSKEMQEVSCVLRRPTSEEFEPTSATSEYSISQLSIPSPGGFFSSLDANSRDTWCGVESTDEVPPSSTTAEHFYNAPWNSGTPHVVEHTVEAVEFDNAETEGPQTAVFIPLSPRQPESHPVSPTTANETEKSAQTLEEVDQELRLAVESALDRTTVWAAAQSTYLSALCETNPINGSSANVDADAAQHFRKDSKASLDSNMKKVVKFLDTRIAQAAGKAHLASSKSDPLFYQAFQHMSNLSSPTDSFIHRHTRFDAIQALRSSLKDTHIDQLLGHYQTCDADRPTPQRPISMMPGKADDEETAEQRVIAQVEREQQALEQVAPAMWIVEALRFLAGGRLLNSPAADVLALAPSLDTAIPPEHVRILDLGGQPQCDWAWHCAREYPNVKTYTATCDHRSINLNLRGPSNHRLVEVDNLFCLPFADNHFDVISARSLPMFLRSEKSLGDSRDEYDKCLRECMRCLKPGGYLEFFLLDSEIVLAGTRGTAASVEFGFNLKARGYDSAPTKSWLARLRRAGLVDIKRAWMFLPMGAIKEDQQMPPETPPPRISTYEDKLQHVEAVQGPVGSKGDIAHVSGLVGSCLWEKWLLKLQMEMGKERGLLDGVGAIIEEGKNTGAGWRCMSGWAQKPL